MLSLLYINAVHNNNHYNGKKIAKILQMKHPIGKLNASRHTRRMMRLKKKMGKQTIVPFFDTGVAVDDCD